MFCMSPTHKNRIAIVKNTCECCSTKYYVTRKSNDFVCENCLEGCLHNLKAFYYVCDNCSKELDCHDYNMFLRRFAFCSRLCEETFKTKIAFRSHDAKVTDYLDYSDKLNDAGFYDLCSIDCSNFKRMNELDLMKSITSWKFNDFHPDVGCSFIVDCDGLDICELNVINGADERVVKLLIDDLSTQCRVLRITRNVIWRDIEQKNEEYSNKNGTFTRPTLDSIWMRLANDFSKRSTCLRNKVGAVIVTNDKSRMISYGYNGDYSGGPNRCESLEPGKCGCSHAEVNALVKASESLVGCHVYVTVCPCLSCAKLLIGKNVDSVMYDRSYRNTEGKELLEANGVEIRCYNDQ